MWAEASIRAGFYLLFIYLFSALWTLHGASFVLRAESVLWATQMFGCISDLWPLPTTHHYIPKLQGKRVENGFRYGPPSLQNQTTPEGHTDLVLSEEEDLKN